MNTEEIARISEAVQAEGAFLTPLREEIGKVIIGQSYLVDRLIGGGLSGPAESGAPGLAKTLAVKTLAATMDLNFSRLQFTPDMLPADVVGTQIYNPQTGEFSTHLGPVHANLVLADEINRAPAKVQSALLEAMQEKQVTIGDKTLLLEEPFLVMATENPIELEGTYQLPEAQVDRFMLKLKIEYPDRAEERQILDLMAKTEGLPEASRVTSGEQILRARRLIDQIYVDDKVKDYVVDLVCATRDPDRYNIPIAPYIQLGASPRATIYLTLAAKAHAFMQGRGYATPQDVKAIALDVLRHRVIITYEAEAEELASEDIAQKLLDTLPVP